MIYMVEIDFSEPENAPHWNDWNDWYNGNLPLIVTVPGVDTAQRLERVAGSAPRYLAVYNVDSPDVFESEAYLAIGGGGTASSRWKPYITRRRNIFSGLRWIPEITEGALLGVIDGHPSGLDLPDLVFAPLAAEGLARSPERRYLTILTDPARAAVLTAAAPGLAFYRPIAPRRLTPRRT